MTRCTFINLSMHYKYMSTWSTCHVLFDLFAETTPMPEWSDLENSPAARAAVARHSNPDAWDVLHKEALGQESGAHHGSLGVKSCVSMAAPRVQDATSATHLQPKSYKVRMCCRWKLRVMPRPQRHLVVAGRPGQTQHGACSCRLRAAPVLQCADSNKNTAAGS